MLSKRKREEKKDNREKSKTNGQLHFGLDPYAKGKACKKENITRNIQTLRFVVELQTKAMETMETIPLVKTST